MELCSASVVESETRVRGAFHFYGDEEVYSICRRALNKGMDVHMQPDVPNDDPF